MSVKLRWTSADLDTLPDDGSRYEIIDGKLHISPIPHWRHQVTCNALQCALSNWDIHQTGVIIPAPGIVFANDNDVVPDVVWISLAQLAAATDRAGHLHLAPELVIEVLSPGKANIQRDREAKLQLYSRRGVEEYWIADWRTGQIDVYRRDDDELQLMGTYREGDTLTSPLLPDFSALVADIFRSARRLRT